MITVSVPPGGAVTVVVVHMIDLFSSSNSVFGSLITVSVPPGWSSTVVVEMIVTNIQ